MGAEPWPFPMYPYPYEYVPQFYPPFVPYQARTCPCSCPTCGKPYAPASTWKITYSAGTADEDSSSAK